MVRLKLDPPVEMELNLSERTVSDTGTFRDVLNCLIDGREKEFEDLKKRNLDNETKLKECEARLELEIERSVNLCKKNANLESILCDYEEKDLLQNKELDHLKAEGKKLLEQLSMSNKCYQHYLAKLQDASTAHEQEKLTVARLITTLQEVRVQCEQKTAENVGLQQQLVTMKEEMTTELDHKVTQVSELEAELKRVNTLLKKSELENCTEKQMREETSMALRKLSDKLKRKDDDHPPEKLAKMTVHVTSTNSAKAPATQATAVAVNEGLSTVVPNMNFPMVTYINSLPSRAVRYCITRMDTLPVHEMATSTVFPGPLHAL